MRRLKILALTAALFMVLNALAVAQANQKSHNVTMQVNSIAVLALAGGNITLTIEAPATGGETPADDTDATCYLRYTATVPASQTRNVTAAWGASDAAPGGTSLLLEAGTPGGTNQGSSAGQKTISDSAENVITGIGSCATGTGASNGSQLTYTLSVSDVTNLIASESKTATVTFTLTDAS